MTSWIAPAILGLVGLWAVMAVHAAGQTLLATVLMGITALGVWTYTSRRTAALRYLFPAIGAALLFVAFPMVYTIGMGLTNHSSRNLLEPAEARAQLLSEFSVDGTTQRAFELRRGAGGVRLLLPAVADQPALLSAVIPADRAAWVPGAPAGAAEPLQLRLEPQAADTASAGTPLGWEEQAAWLPGLRSIRWVPPGAGPALQVISLREVAVTEPLYRPEGPDALKEVGSGRVFRPDTELGFFVADDGTRLQPGFRVFVGLRHYARIFTEPNFREPFLGVFVWTVAFSGLTVLGAGALGLLLASLLNWEPLHGRGVYRVILFLPYAVPAFLSILVFKGLFNQNLGEVNLILEGLFGIRPAWFSDPFLARLMLLIVNIWLGFPYMMVLCSGLIQSIPADLYEASAIAGASPWDNFRRITLPLIAKPLTPLLISAFAFNFNNFVLISLLTGGRPDHLDSDVPAGTTDILVSYTWRIAFQDSGNQYGLAAAISTVIFGLVALITLVQMRMTRADAGARH